MCLSNKIIYVKEYFLDDNWFSFMLAQHELPSNISTIKLYFGYQDPVSYIRIFALFNTYLPRKAAKKFFFSGPATKALGKPQKVIFFGGQATKTLKAGPLKKNFFAAFLISTAKIPALSFISLNTLTHTPKQF